MTAPPHPAVLVHCRFYVRTAVEKGWKYKPVSVDSRDGGGRLVTPHPPAVGDLIWLWDPSTKDGLHGRVIERAWVHASWGSMGFPYTESMPAVGPNLDIIIVKDFGPFRDQAPEEP